MENKVFRLLRWSYPLFAGVVVGVSDIVLVVGGGGGGRHGGGDGRGVFGAYMVVPASLGAIGFPTVLAEKHRLLIIRELSSTTLLVILVPHQTGEMGWTALYTHVTRNVCVIGWGQWQKWDRMKTHIKKETG